MLVETPPAPPAPDTDTDPEPEAGVIEDARARQRRHRMIGSAVVVAAAAIGASVLGFGGGGEGGRTGRASHVRRPEPSAARATTEPGFGGGMRGKIYANWSDFSGATGFVWLVQCVGCIGESGQSHGWLAMTTNGGASWSVRPQRRFLASAPVWSGENGWTGFHSRVGGRFIATHDGGRSWTRATVPDSPRASFVSVADGTVWANARRCRGPYRCVYPVLRGQASGSQLTPVPTTPSDRGDLNIIAVSPSRAYTYSLTGDTGARQAWLTRNGGRTWQSVAPGCPENLITVPSTVGDGHGEIWRSCAHHGVGDQEVGISTDGGRRWTDRPVPAQALVNLYPESARVAWAQSLAGNTLRTLRTTNGGRWWHTVWAATKKLTLPRGNVARAPTLTARSATAATEVVPVVHTSTDTHHTLTNLLVYRTTDGGARWQRTAVALPHGS
jgi:hypothetical protein